ncbi:hypothetical protein YDYSG_26990 [Paenibacillus tyrfis]|uniref:hypothetical protein n=1 Tax=Paenibacillus tyrfis TaxID=1501230 RepID=UPI00249332B8|nr:hypothetical protein [Paenibacillus tyrfis]GLI06669.1 hypothetical protein YDYSG_26990 [Paenibacillus tyrfis]
MDVYQGEEEDINLLTGDFVLKKSDKNDPAGKLIQTEKGKRPKRKLVKLSEFKGKIYDETVIERVETDKGKSLSHPTIPGCCMLVVWRDFPRLRTAMLTEAA